MGGSTLIAGTAMLRGQIGKTRNLRCLRGTGGQAMTNADKIRSMNDEQLADWITQYVEPCSLCFYRQRNRCAPKNKSCNDGRLLWLKQEHKEGEDE